MPTEDDSDDGSQRFRRKKVRSEDNVVTKEGKEGTDADTKGPKKDPDWFAAMKWNRGIVNHWSDQASVGQIRCDDRKSTHFTFRKAFLTPESRFARPQKGDHVYWIEAPDNKDPDQTMAIRVVRDHDLKDMPQLNECILSGRLDRYLLGLDTYEPKKVEGGVRRRHVFPRPAADVQLKLKQVQVKVNELERKTKELDSENDEMVTKYNGLTVKYEKEYKKRKDAEQRTAEANDALDQVMATLKEERKDKKVLQLLVGELRERVANMERRLETRRGRKRKRDESSS
eukprot:gene4047-3677_t